MATPQLTQDDLKLDPKALQAKLQGIDIPSLSDPELQIALQAQQQLGKQPATLDYNKLTDYLTQKFNAAGFKDQDFKNKNINGIIDYVKNTGTLPVPGQYTNAIPGSSNFTDQSTLRDIEGILNPLRESLSSGQFTNNPNTTDAQKTIQDLIDQRSFAADQSKSLQDFYTNTPESLAQVRNNFFDAQQNRAKDYVQNEFAPSAAEQLGARGLGDSGEVGASIGDKYSAIQSSIENERATQEQSDLQFFADMAYKSTLQQMIQDKTNIGSTLQNQFVTQTQKQNQGFVAAQNRIERDFNTNLFRQQNQAALNRYNTELQRTQTASQDKMMSDLVGTGVQTVGNVALIAALG